MIPTQTFEEFPEFANSGTKVKPDDAKYSAGFVPSDVLPAQWMNWLLGKASGGVSNLNSGVKSIEEELNNVVTATGATPDSGTKNQVLNAIRALISNVAGTLANLTTTAKTSLVAAINEVKSLAESKSPLEGSSNLTTYSGGTLSEAAGKSVDQSLVENSLNLPTSKAVCDGITNYINSQAAGEAKTITLKKPLVSGSTISVMLVNGHEGERLELNGIKVKVNRHGALINIPTHEVEGIVKCIQPYTTLDLMYDGTQFIVMGNPVVLSGSSEDGSASYSVKANGLIEQILVAGNVTRIPTIQTLTVPIPFSDTNYAVIGKGMRGGSSNSDLDLTVLSNSQFRINQVVYAYNFLVVGY